MRELNRAGCVCKRVGGNSTAKLFKESLWDAKLKSVSHKAE
jgi:hypothetical protein